MLGLTWGDLKGGAELQLLSPCRCSYDDVLQRTTQQWQREVPAATMRLGLSQHRILVCERGQSRLDPH